MIVLHLELAKVAIR